MHGIHCLMVNGPGINADIRNNLLLVTARMRQELRTKISVRTKYFEGIVKTKLETVLMGSLGGILFEAEIEFERGKTHITFIVNERELLQANHDDVEMMLWANIFTGELDIPEKMFGYDPTLSN